MYIHCTDSPTAQHFTLKLRKKGGVNTAFPGRHLPALMVNTYQQSEHQTGQMDAMDPTLSQCRTFRVHGDGYLHYNARRSSWRTLLVWYSDVRGEAREETVYHLHPHEPHSFALDVMQRRVPFRLDRLPSSASSCVLLACFKYFV